MLDTFSVLSPSRVRLGSLEGRSPLDIASPLVSSLDKPTWSSSLVRPVEPILPSRINLGFPLLRTGLDQTSFLRGPTPLLSSHFPRLGDRHESSFLRPFEYPGHHHRDELNISGVKISSGNLKREDPLDFSDFDRVLDKIRKAKQLSGPQIIYAYKAKEKRANLELVHEPNGRKDNGGRVDLSHLEPNDRKDNETRLERETTHANSQEEKNQREDHEVKEKAQELTLKTYEMSPGKVGTPKIVVVPPIEQNDGHKESAIGSEKEQTFDLDSYLRRIGENYNSGSTVEIESKYQSTQNAFGVPLTTGSNDYLGTTTQSPSKEPEHKVEKSEVPITSSLNGGHGTSFMHLQDYSYQPQDPIVSKIEFSFSDTKPKANELPESYLSGAEIKQGTSSLSLNPSSFLLSSSSVFDNHLTESLAQNGSQLRSSLAEYHTTTKENKDFKFEPVFDQNPVYMPTGSASALVDIPSFQVKANESWAPKIDFTDTATSPIYDFKRDPGYYVPHVSQNQEAPFSASYHMEETKAIQPSHTRTISFGAESSIMNKSPRAFGAESSQGAYEYQFHSQGNNEIKLGGLPGAHWDKQDSFSLAGLQGNLERSAEAFEPSQGHGGRSFSTVSNEGNSPWTARQGHHGHSDGAHSFSMIPHTMEQDDGAKTVSNYGRHRNAEESEVTFSLMDLPKPKKGVSKATGLHSKSLNLKSGSAKHQNSSPSQLNSKQVNDYTFSAF